MPFGAETHQADNSREELYSPYQSIGARGVNNLASKLLLALFPPTIPPFRLVQDRVQFAELSDDEKKQVEQDAVVLEQETVREINRVGARTAINEALRHLIVAGNWLLHIPQKGSLRGYRLDQYVVDRDFEGNPHTIVLVERLSRQSAPEVVRSLIPLDSTSDDIPIFTCLKRDGKIWTGFQEVHGKRVPKTDQKWKLETFPYLALRMEIISGEDYGRGYVEQYHGDLSFVDGLSKSLQEGAATAARCNPLVRPSAMISPQDLANAENLEPLEGEADDVSFIKVDKAQDLGVAANVRADLKEDLGRAFLNNQAFTRNAERVTLGEVNFVAQELEDALGGVYSVLSQDLTLPIVKSFLERIKRRAGVPKIPEGLAEPAIVTGLDAIGRGHDLQKFERASAVAVNLFGPEAVSAEFTIRQAMQFIFTMAGLNPEDAGLNNEEQSLEARQGSEIKELLGNKGLTDLIAQVAQNPTAPEAA